MKKFLPLLSLLVMSVLSVAQTTKVTSAILPTGCVHSPSLGPCFMQTSGNQMLEVGSQYLTLSSSTGVVLDQCANPTITAVPGGSEFVCGNLDAIVLYYGYKTRVGMRYTIQGGTVSVTE